MKKRFFGFFGRFSGRMFGVGCLLLLVVVGGCSCGREAVQFKTGDCNPADHFSKSSLFQDKFESVCPGGCDRACLTLVVEGSAKTSFSHPILITPGGKMMQWDKEKMDFLARPSFHYRTDGHGFEPPWKFRGLVYVWGGTGKSKEVARKGHLDFCAKTEAVKFNCFELGECRFVVRLGIINPPDERFEPLDSGVCRLCRREVCDGKDNDCDGQVDEDVQKTAEVCDGVDNDCNGQIDENITRPCYTGKGGCTELPGGSYQCASPCTVGTQKCKAGEWGVCEGQVVPTAEVCDGKDNNCDGTIDEGDVCVTAVCKVGEKRECAYSGPASALGQGPCVAGQQSCVAGQWGPCAGEVLPVAEICDGVDNDCDGQVDQDLSRPCYSGPAGTAGKGLCLSGKEVCSGGKWGACVGEVGPTQETCNGKDDDCNGQTDEGGVCGACDPSTAQPRPCYGGPAGTAGKGPCKEGTQKCVPDGQGGGAWGACEGDVLPGTETCDGVDNDCDGQIDQGLTRSCFSGRDAFRGVGECKDGKQTCVGGQWGACVGEVGPTAETCNGKDDDCDGTVDGFGGGVLDRVCYLGAPGTSGVGECKDGKQKCAAGQWGSCSGSVTPVPEVCDNKDNDCNGQIDDGLTRPCYEGPANTAGVGVCKGGTQTCSVGQWGACQGQVVPGTETCNGVDDDCNGQVDEIGCTQKCTPGFVQSCNVPGKLGRCRPGKTTCQPDGTWGACTGRTPVQEICNNQLDDDCDGTVDEQDCN